jgi:uncharacterized protein (TIGR02145 family)
MAENLKTSHFAEGTEIPQVQDSLTWKNLFYSSWCYYNNNQSLGETYGKLYNWYTTVDNRNVCPIGWHVPDSEDWNELSNFLGGIYIAGAKLKSATVGWEYPNISTNESEFSALPGGYRASLDAGFENLLLHGSWWSSTQSNASTALGYVLLHHSSLLGYSPDFGKNSGYSIRCIKD